MTVSIFQGLIFKKSFKNLFGSLGMKNRIQNKNIFGSGLFNKYLPFLDDGQVSINQYFGFETPLLLSGINF